MSERVDRFYIIIEENDMSGEEVANLLLNYHGEQLITSEFIEFMEDEGYYI